MFKILSGATKDIGRYEMLRKIGVRKELLIKSMYKELGIVFLFPDIGSHSCFCRNEHIYIC